MNINKMKKEELELLSFTDIAYEILKKEKVCKSTVDLFKQISELLELSEDEYTAKIGDFYTSLTTDKRFFALDNGEWDLKEKHSTKVIIDDDDEDFEVEVEENNDKEEKEVTEDTTDYDANEDYEDNGLEDLNIVNEDEKFDE